MKSLLNHKLYNKDYPLSSEEEKERFLREEKFELLEILRSDNLELKCVAMGRIKAAERDMKNPVSVFGTIKWNAVMHNKTVSDSLEIDLKKLYEKKEEPERVLYKFTMYPDEEISMDDINNALTIVNKNKRWRVTNFLMRCLACGVLAFIVLILSYII